MIKKTIPLPRDTFIKQIIDLVDTTNHKLHPSISSSEKFIIDGVKKLIDDVFKKTKIRKSANSKVINFMAPLGTGKSTISTALFELIPTAIKYRERYLENPFWKASQSKGSPLMFRSQLWFLLANIDADKHAHLNNKITISDTGTLTDALMWIDSYKNIGHLNNLEEKTYMKLFNFLSPVIPDPDIMVFLIPESAEKLAEGVRMRAARENARKTETELIVNHPDFLRKQINRVKKLSRKAIKNNKYKSFVIDNIDPIALYKDKSLKQTLARKIADLI